MKVFPGAVGWGTDTIAGRGGTVIHVTNLNDSGGGSLRTALTASGPRIVVFDVSGIIHLNTTIVISNPYLTVYGQTAPSPGITIADNNLALRTHDILLQHLRVRPGASSPQVNAIDIMSPSVPQYNIVIDHCSVSWAVNKNISLWNTAQAYYAHDITISNCITAESLIYPPEETYHNLLVGQYSERITILNNLFLHNDWRDPGMVGVDSIVVVNNVSVNTLARSMIIHDNGSTGEVLDASLVGNVIITGADTANWWDPILIMNSLPNASSVYADDNYIEDNRAPPVYETGIPEDPWDIITCDAAKEAAIRVESAPLWPAGLTAQSCLNMVDYVVANAGARPWDRDEVDQRLVRDLLDRTGQIIDDEDEVGGYPPSGGLTRTLEEPDDPDGDYDGDGYDDIEEYAWNFETMPHADIDHIEAERIRLFSVIRPNEIARGTYLQCIDTPPAKSDGLSKSTFDTARKPDDETEDWTDIGIDDEVSGGTRCQFYVHRYNRGADKGFLMGSRVWMDGAGYRFTRHYGDETRDGPFDTWHLEETELLAPVYADDSNLQGLWLLNEASGTRYDETGNDNDLTDNNTVMASLDHKIGTRSANFEQGNGEYLSITDAAQTGLDITGSITICAWISPESFTAAMGHTVCSKCLTTGNQRSYILYVQKVNGDYCATFFLSDDGESWVEAIGATALRRKWTHIAGVYNGTDIRVYVNGRLDSNGADNPKDYSDGIFNSTAQFRLGSLDGGAWLFDGLIDGVSIFNRALSANEILSIYSSGVQDPSSIGA